MPTKSKAKRPASKSRTKAKAKASSNSNRGAPKGGQTQRADLADKLPRIKKMRDQGKAWGEIAEKLKITAGTAQYLVLVDSVKPAERIKWDGENLNDLGKKIVRARDKEGLSWPVISARLTPNVTVGRVTDIYSRVKEGDDAGGKPRGRPKGKATKGKSTRSTARRKGAAKSTSKRTAARGKAKAKTSSRKGPRRKGKVKDPS